MKSSEQPYSFARPEAIQLLPATKKIIGYPQNADTGGSMGIKLIECINIANLLSKPCVKVARDRIQSCDSITIRGFDTRIESSCLGRLAAKIQEPDMIIYFAVTIGAAIDSEIERLRNKSLHEALILHAACAAVTDYYSEELEVQLRRQAVDEGFDITARFSPGYCDWNLNDGQDTVFGFLQPETIGIRRLQGGIMIPERTITGIVLRGKNIEYRTACSYCMNSKCTTRREPQMASK